MLSLILASSSPYRKKRLADAGLSFSCVSPDIDESAMKGEKAEALSLRLAKQKAEKVAQGYQSGIVIGSDQVACVPLPTGERRLEKPLSVETARKQLSICSGQCVIFYTALHVIDIKTKKQYSAIEQIEVKFRTLSESQITTYLNIDCPLDCAGSFKMEKAGIFLFESIASKDPNALIGIPMIALAKGLNAIGHDVFDFMSTP